MEDRQHYFERCLRRPSGIAGGCFRVHSSAFRVDCKNFDAVTMDLAITLTRIMLLQVVFYGFGRDLFRNFAVI